MADNNESFRDKATGLFSTLAVFGGLGEGIRRAYKHEDVRDSAKKFWDTTIHGGDAAATTNIPRPQNPSPTIGSFNTFNDSQSSFGVATENFIKDQDIISNQLKHQASDVRLQYNSLRKQSITRVFDTLRKDPTTSVDAIDKVESLFQRISTSGPNTNLRGELRNLINEAKGNPSMVKELNKIAEYASRNIAKNKDIMQLAIMHQGGGLMDLSKMATPDKFNKGKFLIGSIGGPIGSSQEAREPLVKQLARRLKKSGVSKDQIESLLDKVHGAADQGGLNANVTIESSKQLANKSHTINIEFLSGNESVNTMKIPIPNQHGMYHGGNNMFVFNQTMGLDANGGLKVGRPGDFILSDVIDRLKGATDGSMSPADAARALRDIEKEFATNTIDPIKNYIGSDVGIKTFEDLTDQAKMFSKVGKITGENPDAVVKVLEGKGRGDVLATPDMRFNNKLFVPGTTANWDPNGLILDTFSNPNSAKILRNTYVDVNGNSRIAIAMKESQSTRIGSKFIANQFNQRIYNTSDADRMNKIFKMINTAGEINEKEKLLVTGYLHEDQSIINQAAAEKLNVKIPYTSDPIPYEEAVRLADGELSDVTLESGTPILMDNGSVRRLKRGFSGRVGVDEAGKTRLYGYESVSGLDTDLKFFGEGGAKTLPSGYGNNRSIYTAIGLYENEDLRAQYENAIKNNDANTMKKIANKAMTKAQDSHGAYNITGIGTKLIKKGYRGEALKLKHLVRIADEDLTTGWSKSLWKVLEDNGLHPDVADGAIFDSRNILPPQVMAKITEAAKTDPKLAELLKAANGAMDTPIDIMTGVMDQGALIGGRATINQEFLLNLQQMGLDDVAAEFMDELVVGSKPGEARIFRNIFDASQEASIDPSKTILGSELTRTEMKDIFSEDSAIKYAARKKVIDRFSDRSHRDILTLTEGSQKIQIPINTVSANHLKEMLQEVMGEDDVKTVEEMMTKFEVQASKAAALYESHGNDTQLEEARNQLKKDLQEFFQGKNSVHKLMTKSQPLHSMSMTPTYIDPEMLGQQIADESLGPIAYVNEKTFKRMAREQGVSLSKESGVPVIVGRYPAGGMGNTKVMRITPITGKAARHLHNNKIYFPDTKAGRYAMKAMLADTDGDNLMVALSNTLIHRHDIDDVLGTYAKFDEYFSNINEIIDQVVVKGSADAMSSKFQDIKTATESLRAMAKAEKGSIGQVTNAMNVPRIATLLRGLETGDPLHAAIYSPFSMAVIEATLKAKKNLASGNEAKAIMLNIEALDKTMGDLKNGTIDKEKSLKVITKNLNDIMENVFGGIGKESKISGDVLGGLNDLLGAIKETPIGTEENVAHLSGLIDDVSKRGLTPFLENMADDIVKAPDELWDLVDQFRKRPDQKQFNAVLATMFSKRVGEANSELSEIITSAGRRAGQGAGRLRGIMGGLSDIIKTAWKHGGRPVKIGIAAGAAITAIMGSSYGSKMEDYELPDAAKSAQEIEPSLPQTETINVGAPGFDVHMSAIISKRRSGSVLKRVINSISGPGANNFIDVKDSRDNERFPI